MIRAIFQSGVWYAIEIPRIDYSEMSNLNTFLAEGTTVTYAEDIETLRELFGEEVIEVPNEEEF